MFPFAPRMRLVFLAAVCLALSVLTSAYSAQFFSLVPLTH